MAGEQPWIVVALDVDSAERAEALAARLDPALCRLKVGKELFTRAGPGLVERLQARGFSVFLDLKFHDIPNTVAGACRAAADLGVWMVNVHALGGVRMMEAAREAVSRSGQQNTLLIGVTVLTSHDAGDIAAVGLGDAPDALVERLAGLALGAGLDGLVCSAREAPRLRALHGNAPVLVTPGIRPADAVADDQRRIVTPAQARADGADYLVVGRPITAAADPGAALEGIAAELQQGPSGA
ncbi:orotidine-5'-phosphate decarboxylase [Aquisalimonas asiatica]|uniref:Orotidine 5'-phosphate decarboxylase n=1 Tax=Aquisalimonas asiatica TaxID=406100 RepID=A0A1H8RTM2_9GAMM|nr:orotidine-5'-phosphate decarboxylase [Aquisalimonas asiatica]SEO69676.1 orotidine-5'-phosphate decarboxylase [Aquisalimonas asiatica]